MVWRPADPSRFAVLGLADSDPNGELAADASTGDVLAYGLVPRGALDPIDGILEGVRAELEVLSTLHESPIADTLEMLSRRLEVAIVLLRRADGRERIPEVEPSPEDEPEDGEPAEPEAEATTTPAAAATPTMPEEGAPAAPLEVSDHVPERLPRRGRWRMPFEPAHPAPPARYTMLGLAAPLPTNELPPNATTADVLIRGLTPFGVGDPVDGILESVRAGLGVVRMELDESRLSDVLEMIDRRIFVAIVLLRRTDGREWLPEVEPSPEDEPEDGEPAEPEAEATTTPAAEAAPIVSEEGTPVAPSEARSSTPPSTAPPAPADVAPLVPERRALPPMEGKPKP